MSGSTDFVEGRRCYLSHARLADGYVVPLRLGEPATSEVA